MSSGVSGAVRGESKPAARRRLQREYTAARSRVAYWRERLQVAIDRRRRDEYDQALQTFDQHKATLDAIANELMSLGTRHRPMVRPAPAFDTAPVSREPSPMRPVQADTTA